MFGEDRDIPRANYTYKTFIKKDRYHSNWWIPKENFDLQTINKLNLIFQ